MVRVAGCQRQLVRSFTAEVAGRGKDPTPCAGRLLAGSVESPELARSFAFRMPARVLRSTSPASGWGAASPCSHSWLLLPPRHCQAQLLQLGWGHLKRRNSLKKRVALIMLIIALQFDVTTSKKKKRLALIMLIIALMN